MSLIWFVVVSVCFLLAYLLAVQTRIARSHRVSREVWFVWGQRSGWGSWL